LRERRGEVVAHYVSGDVVALSFCSSPLPYPVASPAWLLRTERIGHHRRPVHPAQVQRQARLCLLARLVGLRFGLVLCARDPAVTSVHFLAPSFVAIIAGMRIGSINLIARMEGSPSIPEPRS